MNCKLTVFALALSGILCSARGEYFLRWAVDFGDSPKTFAFAELVDGKDMETPYYTVGEESWIMASDIDTANPAAGGSQTPAVDASLGGTLSENGFRIKFYNLDDDGEVVGTYYTTALLFSQYSDYIYDDATEGIKAGYGSAYPLTVRDSAEFFSSAPEPTGGVLLTLGLAILATRRKKLTIR